MARAHARVDWIDYGKGLCIVAVVCLYSTYYVYDETGGAGWMQYWVDFAKPFRMPDFFLISGLFLSRTIDRPWREFIDKKILHFAYFFALWTTLYFALRELQIDHSNEPGATSWWAEYLSWYVDPFHQLWFIEMLPAFFLVTRLTRNVPWFVILPIAALLQIMGVETGFGQVDRFCDRYIYFYVGYAFAPAFFEIAAWAQERPRKAAGLLIAWAVGNESLVLTGVSEQAGVSLVLGFAGAGAVIVTATLFARLRWMAWLKYLGRNSIVIFLSFFVFVVLADKAISALSITDLGARQLSVTVVAIAAAILLHLVVRGTPARYLFERPKWAVIGPQSLSAFHVPASDVVNEDARARAP